MGSVSIILLLIIIWLGCGSSTTSESSPVGSMSSTESPNNKPSSLTQPKSLKVVLFLLGDFYSLFRGLWRERYEHLIFNMCY